MFGFSDLSFKLRFYNQLLDYIRVIAVYIVRKNKLEDGFDYTSDATLGLLADLLVHVNVARRKNGTVSMKKTVMRVYGNRITDEFIADPNIDELGNRVSKSLMSFTSIFELVKLYRDPGFEPATLEDADDWKQLISEGALDYEIRLAETLYQLTKWEQGCKIESPFTEAYYSESGRNAFENFTKYKFTEILNQANFINPNEVSVLDVGCGYGNYIQAVQDWNGNAQVDGLELQADLLEETKGRFNENTNIQLFNEDILHFENDKQYDLILLNYVLFYFSEKDKKALLEKLKSKLSKNGRILICQYYAGIEPMKLQLARKQKELSVTRRIEMFYANKILYANALWNQTASTFAEAETWGGIEQTLSDTVLEIKRITNADKFYYSLFLEVG